MISVIMSVYNETEQELKQSIESILNQTYTEFEFIIVNDNPRNDRIRNYLEFCVFDKRIILVENDENIGLAKSLNKAINVSRGEYIARMDADDIASEDRLQIELDFLNGNNLDLVCGNAVFIDENGLPLDSSRQRKGYYSLDLSNLLTYTNPIMHPTVLAKADAFKAVGGYRNFPCAQDYDMWLRMASKNIKMGSTDSVVLRYRIRSESISKKNALKQYLTHQYGLKLFRERKKNNGIDSYSDDNYNKYLFDHCAENIESIRAYQKVRENCDLAIQNIKEKKIVTAAKNILKTCFFNPYGYKMIKSVLMVGIMKRVR